MITFTFPPPKNRSKPSTLSDAAQQRLISKNFSLYQLSLASTATTTRKENAIAFSRPRGKKSAKLSNASSPSSHRRAKTRPGRNRVRPRKARSHEPPPPRRPSAAGKKPSVALQAAVIAIENGCQAALMAPTENSRRANHFLSARRVLAPGGHRVELLISGLKARRKNPPRSNASAAAKRNSSSALSRLIEDKSNSRASLSPPSTSSNRFRRPPA